MGFGLQKVTNTSSLGASHEEGRRLESGAYKYIVGQKGRKGKLAYSFDRLSHLSHMAQGGIESERTAADCSRSIAEVIVVSPPIPRAAVLVCPLGSCLTFSSTKQGPTKKERQEYPKNASHQHAFPGAARLTERSKRQPVTNFTLRSFSRDQDQARYPDQPLANCTSPPGPLACSLPSAEASHH